MGRYRCSSLIGWCRQLFSPQVGQGQSDREGSEENGRKQVSSGDETSQSSVKARAGSTSESVEAEKMAKRFEKAFEIIVGLEGGYVNDPNDPGKETKFGISKRSYPDLDIKNLTLDRAREIYLQDYWKKAGCDALPFQYGCLVFDCAVNQGVSVAKDLWAKAKGEPAYFMAERALRYARTRNYKRYGRGWMRRLFLVYEESARI